MALAVIAKWKVAHMYMYTSYARFQSSRWDKQWPLWKMVEAGWLLFTNISYNKTKLAVYKQVSKAFSRECEFFYKLDATSFYGPQLGRIIFFAYNIEARQNWISPNKKFNSLKVHLGRCWKINQPAFGASKSENANRVFMCDANAVLNSPKLKAICRFAPTKTLSLFCKHSSGARLIGCRTKSHTVCILSRQKWIYCCRAIKV